LPKGIEMKINPLERIHFPNDEQNENILIGG
jgi:hypothetical protein